MEYTWTDRNELDRINEQFDEEFYQLQKTVSNIKEIAPSCKIGNIGLYSGNKMRSFYRRYKENNVSYADSKVLRAIETYFMFQYDNIPLEYDVRSARKITQSAYSAYERDHKEVTK